jgi:ATP synthase protein I
MQKNQKKKKKEKTDPLKDYAKYSSLAFQMAIIIGAGTWFGHWLDTRTAWKFPVFVIVFSLFSVGLAIYYVVKQL